MKTAIFCVLVLLSGCASSPTWAPETLAPSAIEIRFLSDQEWSAMNAERKSCDGEASCHLLYQDVIGVAYYKRDPCVIYFPANNGMPSYHTIAHEIRHCYQGLHQEWK